MTTHTAIVDDRDPTIAYSGSWLLGGVAEEFDGTTTAPTGQDAATAAFSFVGTSVTVYATVAARNLTIQPTWTFTVDGSSLGSFTPHGLIADVHHQDLWTSPSLSPNDNLHNLVIKQTSVVSDTYDPAWKLLGSEGDFQLTSQASQAQGDSLTFQFEGKSISFYGGVTSTTVTASISIDGGPPTLWVPPPAANLTNHLIFYSGDLTPGIHTLVVTATNDQPVSADYFLVTPNAPGTSSSARSSSASSLPSSNGPTQIQSSNSPGFVPSSSLVGSSASSSASPSSIGPNSTAHSNSPNVAPIGTIVSVVVALGIGLPLILGVSLFVCRFMRRRVEGQQRSHLAQSRVFSFSPPSVERQGRGGMILSNKLMRAMEMAGQRHVTTVPSASTSRATLTGTTGQQREIHGAPPPVYEE